MEWLVGFWALWWFFGGSSDSESESKSDSESNDELDNDELEEDEDEELDKEEIKKEPNIAPTVTRISKADLKNMLVNRPTVIKRRKS